MSVCLVEMVSRPSLFFWPTRNSVAHRYYLYNPSSTGLHPGTDKQKIYKYYDIAKTSITTFKE